MATRRITVRMLGKVYSTFGNFKEGDVVELLPSDAQPLIDSGAAEKVTAADIEADGSEVIAPTPTSTRTRKG